MIKTLLISFISVFALTKLSAQIQLAPSDISDVPKTFYEKIDNTNTAAFSIGTKGPDKMWNFSGLGNDDQDSTVFVAPGSTPYASTYPGSTVAIKEGTDFSYYSKSASEVSAVGYIIENEYISEPFKLKFIPGVLVMKFPGTFDLNFSSNTIAKDRVKTSIAVSSFLDSARITVTILSKDTIDAWGELTTPSGKYSTLRVLDRKKTISKIEAKSKFTGTWDIISEDTAYVRTYLWFAKSIGVPVMTITMADTVGSAIDEISYYTSSLTGTNNGILSNQSIVIKPNPNNGEFTLDLNDTKSASVKIYNALGLQVYEGTHGRESKINLNNNLPAGVYKVQVNIDGQTTTQSLYLTK